jgi:dihydroorotase
MDFALFTGDVLTHTYGVSGTGGPALVDTFTNIVKPYVIPARLRGVIFDAADGGAGANFAFSQAIPAIQQGFLADTISTDITINGLTGIVHDLNNMMSKFMAAGINDCFYVDLPRSIALTHLPTKS